MSDKYDIVIEGRMPPANISLEKYVAEKAGIDNPSDKYLFEFTFNSDKIKLPNNFGTIESGDDYPDIVALITSGYKSIGSLAEIEERLDVIRNFLQIPIRIYGYHIDNIGAALDGNRVEPITFVYNDGSKAIIEEIEARSDSLVNSFVDRVWGVIRTRSGGRFAKGVIRADVRPGDTIIGVNGVAIRIAPSGQIRMKNGSLGPKVIQSMIKQRKDGSIWFKTSKGALRKWK